MWRLGASPTANVRIAIPPMLDTWTKRAALQDHPKTRPPPSCAGDRRPSEIPQPSPIRAFVGMLEHRPQARANGSALAHACASLRPAHGWPVLAPNTFGPPQDRCARAGLTETQEQCANLRGCAYPNGLGHEGLPPMHAAEGDGLEIAGGIGQRQPLRLWLRGPITALGASRAARVAAKLVTYQG